MTAQGFSTAALATILCLACSAPPQLPHERDDAPAPDASSETPSGAVNLPEVLALDVELLAGPVPTYYSTGYAERARGLQQLVQNGRQFFADSLDLNSDVNLAVLSEADWTRLTATPYTIPFFSSSSAMIFLPATTAGPIVDDYLASQPRLPAERLTMIRNAGFDFEDGAHRMVDLIGYHELGHRYQVAYGIQAPGHWVNEFLATYFAYAFLRRARPQLADLWDGMVQPAPDAAPDHTSLETFDRLYFDVGPENYFWYQGTFAARVTEVFRARGLGFLAEVREAFPVGAPTPASHLEVLERLETIHPGFIAWAESL